MTKTEKPHIEIMSPAGSYPALTAAIREGAGSIYFGIGHLNMRSRSASPFTIDDLKKIARICHKFDVRSYLTLNTVVYDEDITAMQKLCQAAKNAQITAIIATDISTIQYARSIGLEIHMSVQANVANLEAVKFYAQFADTIVLARELSLEQIQHICRSIQELHITGPSGQLVQIEIFIHGALCVAVSGKCYMSLAVYNQSANRGACLQNCRRKYLITDAETGDELQIENQYVMSPKDICMIGHLDQIIDAGVSVMKIEGRGRTADYVATTTRVYRQAINSIAEGNYTPERIAQWQGELKEVYNRGFWEGGYYCGNKLGEWSASGHSRATIKRVQVGVVSNYFSKIRVAEFQLKKSFLKPGMQLLFEGPTTGARRVDIDRLYVDGAPAETAIKDDMITVAVPQKVRRNDKVFVNVDQETASQLEKPLIG